MPQRPIFNANFYTASEDKCKQWVSELTPESTGIADRENLVAGLVPHAGWHFSGSVAGRVWRVLSEKSRPETIILFGTVHYPGVSNNTAYPEGSWMTPLGSLEVNGQLARRLADELDTLLELGSDEHDHEHSLEVQLPFVKNLFPESKILPIATPPSCNPVELGRQISRLTSAENVIAVGSTDLTHYGERFMFAPRGTGARAEAWMRHNDHRILDLIKDLRAEEVIGEASENHNACGPGAIAATLAFAREQGVEEGIVLEYKTSQDVSRDETFEMAVGYGGVVF